MQITTKEELTCYVNDYALTYTENSVKHHIISSNRSRGFGARAGDMIRLGKKTLMACA